jgi:hypothetical protein
MSIADRQHCGAAGDERTGDEWLAEPARKAGQPRHQAKQGEGAHPGDAGSGAKAAQVEAALDPDQQAASERGRDPQRLPIPGGVQGDASTLAGKADIAFENLLAQLRRLARCPQ